MDIIIVIHVISTIAMEIAIPKNVLEDAIINVNHIANIYAIQYAHLLILRVEYK